MQSYVKAKMDEKDNSWFPIARAMCLQQSSDELQDRLQRIEDVLKSYVVRVCWLLLAGSAKTNCIGLRSADA